jgi:hypothetical protein
MNNLQRFKTTAEILNISLERARMVEGYLYLQYGRISHLTRRDIRREYNSGGISNVIDLDPKQADWLAGSYGL